MNAKNLSLFNLKFDYLQTLAFCLCKTQYLPIRAISSLFQLHLQREKDRSRWIDSWLNKLELILFLDFMAEIDDELIVRSFVRRGGGGIGIEMKMEISVVEISFQ